MVLVQALNIGRELDDLRRIYIRVSEDSKRRNYSIRIVDTTDRILKYGSWKAKVECSHRSWWRSISGSDSKLWEKRKSRETMSLLFRWKSWLLNYRLDGRWKAIRSKGLCRTCLIPHRKWPCRSGQECGTDGCPFSHHALVHLRIATEPATEHVVRQNFHSVMKFSLFLYISLTLEGNGKKVATFAFLDDGSESTLMDSGLTAELNISCSEDPL